MTVAGEAVCVGRQGTYGKSLYLLLHFAMNLELLLKRLFKSGGHILTGEKFQKYDGVTS